MKYKNEISLLVMGSLMFTACGKVRSVSGGSLQSEAQNERGETINAPVLVKELSTQTSLGKTTLQLYTGGIPTEKTMGKVGVLRSVRTETHYEVGAMNYPRKNETAKVMPVAFDAYLAVAEAEDALIVAEISPEFVTALNEAQATQAQKSFEIFSDMCLKYQLINSALISNPPPIFNIASFNGIELSCSVRDGMMQCGGGAEVLPAVESTRILIKNNPSAFKCEVAGPQIENRTESTGISKMVLQIDQNAKVFTAVKSENPFVSKKKAPPLSIAEKTIEFNL